MHLLTQFHNVLTVLLVTKKLTHKMLINNKRTQKRQNRRKSLPTDNRWTSASIQSNIRHRMSAYTAVRYIRAISQSINQ